MLSKLQSGMGSNVTDKSVGRAIKIVNDTMQYFDRQHGVPDESDTHSKRCNEADMKKVLKAIFDEAKVFLEDLM